MAAPDSPPVVAIVGAGFSGTLLASQLLHNTRRPLRLLLIERSGRFGKGLAYGTTDPSHLLNVSAGAMSAWPDDSNHLLRWLDLNREALTDLLPCGADASSFIPRQLYGLYLQSVLNDAECLAQGQVSLQRISDELVDLEPLPPDPFASMALPRHRLHLKGQPPIEAHHVVLAWGNGAIRPRVEPGQGIRHAWTAEATADLDPEATVALLGTGLTMVDMVVSLHRQGHRGPIVALSRRGHRPNAHRSVAPLGDWIDVAGAPASMLGLWRLIRARADQAGREGQDWRAVIDGLRPRTQALWQRLEAGERRRFLRHAAVVWDVHRHRIAPELKERLERLEASGQLRHLAARLLGNDDEPHGSGRLLRIRGRGQASSEVLRVDRLILCTGIPLAYAGSEEPLLVRLRKRGLLSPDPLALGSRCDAHGALLDAAGAVQPGLHTLGSPRKGQLWESIAVPELRLQARDLAQRLLASLPRHLQGLPPLQAVPAPAPVTPSLLLRQLFDAETSSYTYLIADAESGDAALIDPVLEQLDRDLTLLQELNLQLRLCLETRLHTDHITGAGQLRRRTGCQVLVPAAPGIRNADRLLTGGERLELGSLSIEVIATPGHTPEHVAYRIADSHLFSGDALLIRGCGRTDVPNGDAGQLYDSLQRLLALPETMLVFPSHDASGRSHSSIGEERRHNPKLAGRTRADFIQLMNQEHLAPLERLHEALPANRHLGDLQPSDQYDHERRQLAIANRQAQATEEANKEIYNAFLGMFI